MADLVPRAIRATLAPLGLYFRAGRHDRQALLQIISEGKTSLNGIVFDACSDGLHGEVIQELNSRRLETVFDSRAMELATLGGFAGPTGRLPWASDGPHAVSDLVGQAGVDFVGEIVNHVISKGYSSVLSPSHFVQSADDPWLHIDALLTEQLRLQLDRANARSVPISYVLALPRHVFCDDEQLSSILASIEHFPINALWLRVHPFGSDCSPNFLKAYIQACRRLHSLQIPIVAERTNIAGLALIAFGAAGGIEAGITTFGEKFDASRLSRAPKSNSGFQQPPRVYVRDLALSLARDEAESLLSLRQVRPFGCRDTRCCRMGIDDTISDPRRHFLLSRMDEVAALSRIPESVRASEYMERMLRPTTARLARVLSLDLPEKLASRLGTIQKRLTGWRYTLGAMLEQDAHPTFSPAPELRVSRPSQVARA